MHSTNPELPNYLPPYFAQIREQWIATRDWAGPMHREQTKMRYLHQKAGELSEDYKNRLSESYVDNYYAQALDDHASMLNQFSFSDGTPQSLIDNQDNVDLRGSSLKDFDYQMTYRFFRDGVVLVYVDAPTALDEQDQRVERRPRFSWVPILDIFAPRYRSIDGVPTLTQISIRRQDSRPDEEFGSIKFDRYYVYWLTDDLKCFATIWEQEDQKEDGRLVEISTKPVIGANGNQLSRIPIQILSVTPDLNFHLENDPIPPFQRLLDMNIKHFNKESELDTVESKTNLPTPIRYWEMMPDTPGDFYAGPGRCLDMTAGSRVEYLEPLGTGINITYSRQQYRESKMKELDNRAFHTSDRIKTASESIIEDIKSKLDLPGLVTRKESFYQELFKLWEIFSNPSYNGFSSAGGVDISDEAMKRPPTPEQARSYREDFINGLVSRESALRALVRIGVYEQEEVEGMLISPITPVPVPPIPVPIPDAQAIPEDDEEVIG